MAYHNHKICETRGQIARAIIVSSALFVGLTIYTLSLTSNYVSDQSIIDSIVTDILSVKGGEFIMEYGEEQRPGRRVMVSDFGISANRISSEQWTAVVGRRHHLFSPYYDEPEFTYAEIKEFMARLSRLTNMECRLPTEAQWEYAARTDSLFNIKDTTKYGAEICADLYLPYDSLCAERLSETGADTPYITESDTLIVDPCVTHVPKAQRRGHVARGTHGLSRGYCGNHSWLTYGFRVATKSPADVQ